ncbi:AbiV family abortive infection protein [Vibrio alginolyticus]|uniref:AbiV family abortive infection protein n=1 Tax=Vibrio parahaemolyticus TaxID=670 RepID=UPI0023607491|nr:AbiV family abortive infection protein [Vibrio parahaemolyticus]ELA6639613.1 AbiV family abortive infection protein [Vibrio alginolyticus]ELK9268439.1 AbiV family abortive infection protein [Vibrio alginolyticus]
MGTPRIPPDFRFTVKALQELSNVSLDNAEQLISEAKLLLANNLLPRAYFLSVAAIEEVGKAYLCFESSSRNLNDSAVTAKIIKSIENHSNKINAAFHASIQTSQDPEGAVRKAVDLMITLQNGREPSMYTDINYIESKVYTPNSVIREVAATDSVRLAELCYSTTMHYVKNFKPSNKSKVDDVVFGLKSKVFSKIIECEDFWWFMMDKYENNQVNQNEIILEYHKDYFSKNKLFKTEVSV